MCEAEGLTRKQISLITDCKKCLLVTCTCVECIRTVFFDLNLLIVVDAVMHGRNVARARQNMVRLTDPASSQFLHATGSLHLSSRSRNRVAARRSALPPGEAQSAISSPCSRCRRCIPAPTVLPPPSRTTPAPPLAVSTPTPP